jgi:hypothetical protein
MILCREEGFDIQKSRGGLADHRPGFLDTVIELDRGGNMSLLVSRPHTLVDVLSPRPQRSWV